MTRAAAISVSALTKSYGDLLAVDDVSFEVESGSVFSFLGTNGAGKSTVIGCLTTVLPFDAGRIVVGGHEVRHDSESVRARIGVVFQESMLDSTLTVRENLTMRARFYLGGRSRITARVAELATLLGLEEYIDRRYGRLSGGQRRRVDIARALLPSPSILFLDEPTAGLDPANRAIVWATITSLRASGDLTVFLTTHYMEETEQSDRVSIIDHGRVIAEGSPSELRARHSSSVLTVTSRDGAAFVRQAAESGFEARRRGSQFDVRLSEAGAARRLIAVHGDDVIDFEYRHGSMDDVFLALTSRDPSTGGV